MLSYTILTQLSSACCLELVASGRSHPELFLTRAAHSVQDQWATIHITSCAILIREASATGPSIVATFRIIANVQGNARGKICTPNLVSLAGPLHKVIGNGPANNDQSLCYAGGQRSMFQLAFEDPLRTHRVIVFTLTVIND